MIVHQLLDSKVDGSRRTLRARCGATFTARTTDSQPPDVTAWGSHVTCQECRP